MTTGTVLKGSSKGGEMRQEYMRAAARGLEGPEEADVTAATITVSAHLFP